MADTPLFQRAVELVRQLADLDRAGTDWRDLPQRAAIAAELETLADSMTRLEYDRLYLFYLARKEGA